MKNNGWIGNTAALLRLLMNYARCCRSQKRSDTIEHRIIMYRMFSSSLLFSKYWISNLASASHSSPPPILDPQSLAEEECNHRNSCTTSPLPGASSVCAASLDAVWAAGTDQSCHHTLSNLFPLLIIMHAELTQEY